MNNMYTYLSMLDSACLFELLVRVSYPELRNLLVIKPRLYRITNSEHFQKEWKKYNIKLVINSKWVGQSVEAEMDSAGFYHGVVRAYRNNFCYKETTYVQGIPMTSIRYDNDRTLVTEVIYTHIGDDKYVSKTLWSNGQIFSRYLFKNKNLHGLNVDHDADGRIKLCEYIDGIVHHPYVRWFDNGQIEFMMARRVNKDKDVYNFTRWFINGNISQRGSQDRHNRLRGRFQSWNEVGEPLEDTYYD